MPSFVAPCPRGHMGNFVTVGDYHVCFCQLQVPVFKGPENTFPGTEEQDRLMEQYIQEGIAERVEDAITDEREKIEQKLIDKVEELSARLLFVDPEYHP